MNQNNKKIVLIVKASEVGERALKKSIDILEEFKCRKLYLLFVVDSDFFSGIASSYIKSEKYVEKGLEDIGDAILRKMEELVKESKKDISTERIILYGDTAEEVLNFVKNNNVDMLIIPKDKRGPIEKSLTGGDITRFIKEIEEYTIPVMVE